MLNSICLVGSLVEIDNKEPRIRYLLVERVYTNFSDNLIIDKIPLCNWNKEVKGEIFTFKNNSLVAVRGRIETLNNNVVIVVETITYLGLKY